MDVPQATGSGPVKVYLTPAAPSNAASLDKTTELNSGDDYLIDGRASEIKIGCGWTSPDIDVDLSLAVYNKDRTCVDVIWWDKTHSHYVSSSHLNDDRNGTPLEGTDTNEEIKIKLSDVPASVHYLMATLSVYTKGKSLADVSDICLKLSHENKEIVKFKTSNFDTASAVLGILSRSGPWWTFKALGSTAVGRTVKEIVYNMTLDQIVKEPAAAVQDMKIMAWAVEGSNLAASDKPVYGPLSSDCFVEILFRDSRAVSEVIEKSLEPKWNMPKVELGTANEADYTTVEFNVWDHDTNSPDDFLGCALVVIGGVCQKGEGVHTLTLELGPSPKDDIKPGNGVEISGSIVVSFEVSKAVK